MDMFLITLVIIASVIIVIAGYVLPHIVLWYFAMKRKTNVKSLGLLIKKYDGGVSDYFGFSMFMGYFITAVFLLLIYLDSKNSPLTYNDMLLGSIGFPILFVVLMSWALSYFFKDGLDIADDKLTNHSIKI